MGDQTLTRAPRRYKSPQQDSARWDDFPLREGDIVVSSPAKAGTTWVQMICALLIFQTPELPKPLSALSPWLDQLFTPRDQMFAQLAEQEHRRVIKTHVPLDGLPLDPRVSYLVVARHPWTGPCPCTTRPPTCAPSGCTRSTATRTRPSTPVPVPSRSRRPASTC
ncbi:sulfotransferase domain-containing protein [Streptomyces sp. AD16]|nr:sulfotransferase domain-containing protein [Streptomyces sp. AD16]